WKIEDGQQQGPTMKADGNVPTIVISQNGQSIASGEVRRKVILWNAATHEKVHKFTEHTSLYVMGVDISSDGTKLATADSYNVQIFSIPSSDQLHRLPHSDIAGSLSSEWSIHDNFFQPSIASNGRFIACSAGSSVSLWDCMSHKQIGSIITHSVEVRCVTLSASGQYLACGNGNNIMVHDLRDDLPSRCLNHVVSVHPLMKLVSLTIFMLFLHPA
ncbi:hypothetical protein M404DRAFT_148575, partial [Pisolithus tinctorius Marx 270]